MKTKLLVPLALVAVCAALPALAEPIELLANGKPDGSLDGWTNSGPSNFEIYNDGDNDWFEADDDNSFLSQTVDLAEKGITPDVIATEPSMTASLIARGGYAGSASVEQLDADGKGLSIHYVVNVNNTIGATPYAIRFKLSPNARKLKYQLSAYQVFGLYMLKFRDCSLMISRPTMVTFVSDGTTLGTASYVAGETAPAAPTASRVGNYRFLGYFTAETGGDKIYDENYAFAQSSSWEFTTTEATLYAQWGIATVHLSFVSQGATVGTATYTVASDTITTVPTATRAGDYVFLGYFTEETGGVQVFDENCQFVQGSLSSLSPELTLHAHWGIPDGTLLKLVYRGQLNLLSGDGAATNDTAYVKTMHFRVYDAAEATTPLWFVNDQQVTVNADGSFVHAFGDDTLAALIATGKVTHVGLAIGPSADTAVELKPRRELRAVAAVNRALTAEGAALDVRVGNLVTENALVAADATVSTLEVAGRVTAPGAGKVEVSPLVVGPDERTRLMRGGGVNVFSREAPSVLVTNMPALRGQVLATAPSDGIALVSSSASGTRDLRCPAVVQYCREGESVRAPTSDEGGLKVTFFPFIGK